MHDTVMSVQVTAASPLAHLRHLRLRLLLCRPPPRPRDLSCIVTARNWRAIINATTYAATISTVSANMATTPPCSTVTPVSGVPAPCAALRELRAK